MRYTVYLKLALLAFSCQPSMRDPMVIGLGLPLTGSMAQTGQIIKKGAELALEEINASGGIHGRALEIDFQDAQGDPKQAVIVAQKFISDPKILLASDGGSSLTAMACAPLYQGSGLVLCGLYASHLSLTSAGDYIWGNMPPMHKISLLYADYVKKLGLKRVACFFINNDWGRAHSDLVTQKLGKEGIQVALCESYLSNENDFRSLITKAKKEQVDGFILISYLNDGSLLVRQIRSQGLEQPIVISGTVTSNFVQLTGSSSEGVYIGGLFAADDPRPEVAQFVQKWKAKYPDNEVDYFSAHAYDSIILMAEVLKLSDGTRESVKKAFAKVKDVPSVIYNKITFNPATRRIDNFNGVNLIVKDKKIIYLDMKND